MEEVASAQNSSQRWKILIEENDGACGVRPDCLICLLTGSKHKICVAQSLDSLENDEEHEHDHENDPKRANFHENLDVFLRAENYEDHKENQGCVAWREVLKGRVLVVGGIRARGPSINCQAHGVQNLRHDDKVDRDSSDY